MLIVGDGPDRIFLEKMAANFDLSANILFLGSLNWQSAMSYLKSADVVINPSYTEGLPTSVIEAAMCGKPVIVTDVGGTPEIVGRDYPLQFQPGDLKKLTASLKYLLKNKAKRNQLGKLLSKRVDQKYNWSENIKNYERILCAL